MRPRLLPGEAKPLDGDGQRPRAILNLPPALSNLNEVIERVGRDKTSARELGAFQRARAVGCATDLLRLIPAYCLGGMGLRTASAWASFLSRAPMSSRVRLGKERAGSARMANPSTSWPLSRLRRAPAFSIAHLDGTQKSSAVGSSPA